MHVLCATQHGRINPTNHNHKGNIQYNAVLANEVFLFSLPMYTIVIIIMLENLK